MLTEARPEDAAATVSERAGLRTAVVKLGSRGSLVWHDGEVHEIGIHEVKAIDTTGAGDAYAGAFLYGQIQGWDAGACGHLASAVAAQTVSQIGAVYKDRAALSKLAAGLAPT